jgi:hypothetical protein
MPNTVKIKRSAVSGKVPLVADLQLGELAVNTFDGKLYLKKDNGTQSVVEVGGAAGGTTSVASGGTGRTSLTSGNLLVGNGTNAVNFVAPGAYEQVLLSTGSGWFTRNLFGYENTWSNKQLFDSSYSFGARFLNLSERVNVNSSHALGTNSTETMYIDGGATVFYQVNPVADWTMSLNFGAYDYNSRMSAGEAATCVALVNQGATAYKITSVLVEGTASGVSVKWQGGSLPSAGNANSIDCYTFTIIKTADSTFTVLVSLTKFA